MKQPIPPEAWLFDIEEAPVFTTITRRDASACLTTRKLLVPNKKALIAVDNGHVLGVVGTNYRIFTNRAAVDLCKRFCLEAFSDTRPGEWTHVAGHGPATRSWVALDIHHQARTMNLMGTPGGPSDIFTPFARITNSYNGSRALRIEIGFLRKHCSNGVIFERQAATVTMPHTAKGVAEFENTNPFSNMAELCEKFNAVLRKVRAVSMTPEDSIRLVHRVVGWPTVEHDSNASVHADQRKLDTDLAERTRRYFDEIGRNAYAAFNVMTDLAARPPVSIRFRRDRPSLERLTGAWLKCFTEASARADFNLEEHIAAYSDPKSAVAPHQRGRVGG